MNKLLALADRVEKLTGPDREVDAEIAHSIAWRWDGWLEGDMAIEARPLDYVVDRVLNSHNSIWRHLPAYTTSLDAAMTLVLKGWGWMVSQPNEKAIASGLLKERTPVMGEVQYGCDHRYAVACATPALALVAASLRARAHGGGEG